MADADAVANVTEVQLAAITELDLSNQGITSLPKTDLNGLTGLTHLDLSHNDLEAGRLTLVPSHFASLTSLEVLDLSHNGFAVNLPTASLFNGLTALRELYLNDNLLENLNIGGDLFGQLANLEVLHLQNNMLAHPLGGSTAGPFTGLTSLKELDLSGNRLDGLDSLTFRSISISGEAWTGSTTLEKLNLSNNLLTTKIGEREFAGLTALTELDLSENSLEYLLGGVFQEYTDSDDGFLGAPAALTKLYLHDTRFSIRPSLGDGIFEGLTALTELTLRTGMSLTIVLEKVMDGEFKVTTRTGAPFDIVVPVWVTGGDIDSGATTLTIPIGTVESDSLTVTRTAAPTVAVTANMGILPSPPSGHSGYILDTYPPLTIIDAEVAADTTSPKTNLSVPFGPHNSPFTVTITFTESVTGFEVSELVVGGTASVTVAATFPESGNIYTATITPTSDGYVTFKIRGNDAQDAAGNGNTAVGVREALVDLTAPEVTIAPARSGVQNSHFDVTIVFSERITRFRKNKLSVSGAGATVNTVIQLDPPGDRTSYTAAIQPTTDGTVMISLEADSVQDAAGNGNAASDTLSVVVDMTRPGVTINPPDGVQGDEFTVTVVFDESVTGFEQSELSVSGAGATVSDFSGSGAIYTATITPTDEGTVTLSVAAECRRRYSRESEYCGNTENSSNRCEPPRGKYHCTYRAAEQCVSCDSYLHGVGHRFCAIGVKCEWCGCHRDIFLRQWHDLHRRNHPND